MEIITRRTFSDMFVSGPFDRSLYKSLSDATIFTKDGKIFRVHRMIISQISEFFQAAFSDEFGSNTELLISDIDGDTLDEILIYCYTGRIILNEETVGNVLMAADYLLLDYLLEECCSFAIENISISNCIQLYVITEAIGFSYIQYRCLWFIRIHFMDVVCTSPDIGKLPLHCFEQILTDKHLNVQSENIIWKAIVRWVKGDEFRRFPLVPHLLTCINMEEMNEDLAESILSNYIINLNPFCCSLNISRIFEKSLSKQQMISQFTENNIKSELFHIGRRFPTEMHFVVVWDFKESNSIICYLTYNEEIDVWRKLGDLDFFPEVLMSIGHLIFMFDTLANHCQKFDLVNNETMPMWPNFVERHYFCVVSVEQKIYLLGGLTDNGIPSDIVECYDPFEDSWVSVPPLYLMSVVGAVGLQERIYVFGYNFTSEGLTMVSQVYDLEFDTWMYITSPNIPRKNFAVIEAEGKIFLIGGKNDTGPVANVEVYDTFLDGWSLFPDMPFSYHLPNAILLNNRIIVFENTNKRYTVLNPPVYWSLRNRRWKVFRDSSPWSRIEQYNFCTIKQQDVIQSITRQNRRQPVEECKWEISSLA